MKYDYLKQYLLVQKPTRIDIYPYIRTTPQRYYSVFWLVKHGEKPEIRAVTVTRSTLAQIVRGLEPLKSPTFKKKGKLKTMASMWKELHAMIEKLAKKEKATSLAPAIAIPDEYKDILEFVYTK